jgi:hypothetical protein
MHSCITPKVKRENGFRLRTQNSALLYSARCLINGSASHKQGSRRGMAMSNITWVCFDCRQAVRRPGYAPAAVRCPSCGTKCRNIGYKIRLPSKRDAKAWQALRASLQEQAIADVEYSSIHRVRSIHGMEQEIARLEAMPVHPDRRKRIASLRRRIKEV